MRVALVVVDGAVQQAVGAQLLEAGHLCSRTVEQQHLRLGDDGARDRYPLPRAAGELHRQLCNRISP